MTFSLNLQFTGFQLTQFLSTWTHSFRHCSKHHWLTSREVLVEVNEGIRVRDTQLDSWTQCITARWSPNWEKNHTQGNRRSILESNSRYESIWNKHENSVSLTLPVGEIADFGDVGDSKNVWDHVPIETVERFFLMKINHYQNLHTTYEYNSVSKKKLACYCKTTS